MTNETNGTPDPRDPLSGEPTPGQQDSPLAPTPPSSYDATQALPETVTDAPTQAYPQQTDAYPQHPQAYPQQAQAYPQPEQPTYAAPPVPPAEPGYGAPGTFAPQPQAKTNTLAIVSLIVAIPFSILGIILGHISLSQIKRTGENGRGLALAGTILGYVFTFGWILLVILVFIPLLFIASVADSAVRDSGSQLGQIEQEIREQLEGNDQRNQTEEFGQDLEEWGLDETGGTDFVASEHPEYCELILDSSDASDDTAAYFSRLAQLSPSADDGKVLQEIGQLEGQNPLELSAADSQRYAELGVQASGILLRSIAICSGF